MHPLWPGWWIVDRLRLEPGFPRSIAGNLELLRLVAEFYDVAFWRPLRCDELPRRLGFTPPDGPYDTVAGLVLRYLGEIPSVGDTVMVDGWRIAVTHMDRRRIDRVEISPPGGEDA